MASTFRTIALVGSVSLWGCATPDVVYGPEWFACRHDAQCTLVQDPADCSRIPVNQRYAERFEQRLAIEAIGVDSRPTCSESAVKYSGACAAMTCSSRLRVRHARR